MFASVVIVSHAVIILAISIDQIFDCCVPSSPVYFTSAWIVVGQVLVNFTSSRVVSVSPALISGRISNDQTDVPLIVLINVVPVPLNTFVFTIVIITCAPASLVYLNELVLGSSIVVIVSVRLAYRPSAKSTNPFPAWLEICTFTLNGFAGVPSPNSSALDVFAVIILIRSDTFTV